MGAQPWVGRASWHFGSYYLWGDVPALMPITRKHVNGDGVKAGDRNKARATGGHQWTAGFDNHDTIANAQDGRKQKGSGAAWWRGEVGSKSSKSSARKAASAHIAKIPYELALHIARCWYS